MYEDLAKELKKNTEIMTQTFERFNLQILSWSIKPVPSFGDKDADVDVFVELATISEEKIKKDCIIKINGYDEDGDICALAEGKINKDAFWGYDTIKMRLEDNEQLLKICKRARLYATVW